MNKNDKEDSLKDSMSFRDLLTIFLKRKWFFVIFFVAVLMAGLIFTLVKTPLYQSYSVIELKGIYYDENLYKYFPEEAIELGIFAPEMDIKELEGSVLKDISEDIRDDVLLDEVSRELNFDISVEELKRLISPLIDGGNKLVRVITIYDNKEFVYQINNILTNKYLKENKDKKSEIIDYIIQEIDKRLPSLEAQYEEIKAENVSGDTSSSAINSINSIMSDLSKIKYNLENNRETFINNIELLEETSVLSEDVKMDNLKSILITIFSALAVGLIAVYLPGVFTSFKK